MADQISSSGRSTVMPGQEDSRKAAELLGLIYHELRRLAAARLQREHPGQTLQPTALVHEAWLRLSRQEGRSWANQDEFFAAAAEAMRRILVENARRKQRLKHGGGWERASMDALDVPGPLPDEELLALDSALEKLAAINPRAASLVKLCFFTGLTQEEAARELQISVATAERTWAFARVWLFREVRHDLGGK
jgi:RNA polymerase sigma factor (TIGR02999 family)